MFDWFNRLIKRICAPEIEASIIRAKNTEAQAEFWRCRFERQAAAFIALQTDFTKEINSNRRREDALRNQILIAGGNMPLPERESLPPKPEPKTEIVSAPEEEILRHRAVDYCEQTKGTGNFTNTDVETTYRRMLQNPNDWLTD